MNPGGAGDLIITVGGDLTPLETALASVPEAFAGLTSEVTDAFAGLDATLSGIGEAANVASADIQNLANAAAGAEAPLAALGEQMDLFAAAPLSTLPEAGAQLELFATYAGEAATETAALGAAASQTGPSLTNLGNNAAGAQDSLAKLITNIGTGLIAFQLLKSAIEDVTLAFGEEQKSIIALGAILGDRTAANNAVQSVKGLADALGLTQDAAISAQQKLVALGIPLAEIPASLTAIANGAAAMNTSFDTAAQRFDQIINSGTLMARALTSIGLNLEDVARAMGMAGVPTSALNEAFKALDEKQRAAVLSAAELAKNAGVAAQAASGVIGTWNQVKNAIEDTGQEIGKALNGFSGLGQTVVEAAHIAASALLGFVGTVKVVVDSVIVLLQTLVTPVALVGQLIADAFSGKIKQIPADVAAANGAIQDAWKAAGAAIQKDVQDTGDSLHAIWDTTMQGIAASSKAGAGTAAGELNVLQLASQKAEKDFAAASVAFQNGKISVADYTDALNAMNKAQMDANGGIEQFGTAVLIAANNFRTVGVDLVNAKTNLDAIRDAIASGESNWTAYDAALKQLDTDQRNFNNGLADSRTAFLLVSEEFQNMGVAETNAQTQFDAVVKAMATGAANATQYTAALQALNKDQMDLNGGLQQYGTALKIAYNDQDQLKVALANAETALRAQYQVFLLTGKGLQALIDKTNTYLGLNEKVANGVLTWQDAEAKLGITQTQLNLSLQNAGTILAQAQQGYANGTVSLGLLEKAQNDYNAALKAVNGTTKDATSAQTASNTAVSAGIGLQKAFADSARNAAGVLDQASHTNNDYATSLQYINGQWVTLGGQSAFATSATNTFASSIQVLNGHFVNLGNSSASAISTGLSPFATQLQVINGQFVSLPGNASAAANGIDSVGKAAATVTGQLSSMVSELDTFMGDVAGLQNLGQSLDKTMSASLGSLSLNLKPGDQYSQRQYEAFPLGGLYSDASYAAAVNSGETPPGSTMMTFDPQDVVKQVTQAATTATAAAITTSATTVSDALTKAIADANAANDLEAKAMAAQGTAAFDALKASADAAVAAAGQELIAAQGQTVATQATTSALTTLSTTASAASGIIADASTSIATASEGVLGVVTSTLQAATKILGPAQGVGSVNITTPNVNLPTTPGVTGGAANTALLGTSTQPGPNQGSIINLNVNLAGSVLTGANGLQQLQQQIASSMVNQLERMGIRITRG